MQDAFFVEERAHGFGLFYGCSPDKHRLAFNILLFGNTRRCRELCGNCPIYRIRFVTAYARLVRRDDNHPKTIDRLEFLFFGFGGAGHAGKFFIETKIILERNRRKGFALALN